ncbi:GNAT family N-acetyltransferase [Leclercia adecarboxylata]|uniref:GNAT family N-acetyltransferase n=1 Tax=Leclercia adecarboxylata TaxID=83655 RepID=UPI0024481C44|nr:GNAT family N-acetyltransferase [Leclercia adecarboxylata]MDH0063579.1 GNAT family N-acetyltransferase [Leclercia adecarboxylata]
MHILKNIDKNSFYNMHLDAPPSIERIKLLILDDYSDFESYAVKNLFVKANDYYPCFHEWYKSKLVNDVIKNKSKYRDFFKDCHIENREGDHLRDSLLLPDGRFVLAASVDEQLAGLSVLKIHPSEYKISTFFIDDKFSGIGLGSLLLNCSLSLLKGKNVNITVSEDALDKMVPFLTKNGFLEYKTITGEYLKNKKETHFIKK